MYSWCMACERCTARQLRYCTYLCSLVYACTCIYGTSIILLTLRKMPCHTVDIIIRNVAIQGLFSSDLVSLWCHISIVDSLRDNHQGSLFDLLQLLSWHFLMQPRITTPVNLTNKNVFVTPFSYSRNMTSVCRDSRSVKEHSAYGFSTYGTRYRGSIFAGTRSDALWPSRLSWANTHFSNSRSLNRTIFRRL